MISSQLYYVCGSQDQPLHLDIWSNKRLPLLYFGITGHLFLSHDHRRHCVTLAAWQLFGSHTAEAVREILEEVMKEWGIPKDKVNAVVTDNGSNNMVVAFKSHFEEEEDVEGTDLISNDSNVNEEDFVSREAEFDISFSLFIKRIPCFAHILQLHCSCQKM